jgi:hypothetical protein
LPAIVNSIMGCAAQRPITPSVNSKAANSTRFDICPPYIVVTGDGGGNIAQAAGKDKPPIHSAPVSGLCQLWRIVRSARVPSVRADGRV